MVIVTVTRAEHRGLITKTVVYPDTCRARLTRRHSGKSNDKKLQMKHPLVDQMPEFR